jgi:hypothetical protein
VDRAPDRLDGPSGRPPGRPRLQQQGFVGFDHADLEGAGGFEFVRIGQDVGVTAAAAGAAAQRLEIVVADILPVAAAEQHPSAERAEPAGGGDGAQRRVLAGIALE